MPLSLHRVITAAVAAFCCVTSPAVAQRGPVNGMRPAELRTHAITNATVVTQPGTTIENATIIIRDGLIQQVGDNVMPPDGAVIHDGEGLTVYPGLIDAALMIDIEAVANGEGAHWSDRITPQISVAQAGGPNASIRDQMRQLGFTVAAVYPESGIMRGSGAVYALTGGDQDPIIYDERAAMAMAFESGWGSYPSSLMGAIALARQTLHDGQWYQQAMQIWREHPQHNDPPMQADALAALNDVINGEQRVLFDVRSELDALRADRLAQDFNLNIMLLGSGTEFRRLESIVNLQRPLIIPLSYPDRPEVATVHEAESVTLRELMNWEQAPTNPRRLVDAGATMALTTHRLDRRSSFFSALHKAIEHGLAEDEALAALTTIPADLLGIDHLTGRIASGMAANLVIVDGSLFDKKPKIRATWVAGREFEIDPQPIVELSGKFEMKVSGEQPDNEITGTLDTRKRSLSIKPPDGKPVKAKKVIVQTDRISFVLPGHAIGEDGYIVMTGLINGSTVKGTGTRADGSRFSFALVVSEQRKEDDNREDAADAEPEGQDDGESNAEDESQERGDEADDEADAEKEAAFDMPPDAYPTPLGAFGRVEVPQPQTVMITNATIWTAGSKGIIEDGWLVVEGGKIVAVGSGPLDVLTQSKPLRIDAQGKHITPGLIDCHSHTGVSGSVNEFRHTNSADVSIGDVIDPDDIAWYRELAGGLTAANQLHGSANPIGGQNSVVKLKWGGDADAFSVDDAIPGIKFALGENVKRSSNRYPDTRMGVETFIRDAFTSAVDYREQWEAYSALSKTEQAQTIPPRRDLKLDALVEIMNGERIVHCHSYRQDEILMLIRLADEFGFTIGTFQHVLEGYKVAEAIAEHGAGASAFTDWWAYKVEVMDAIPFNGVLMSDVGVLVSFNSDSNELARRMNTEAAKAVRYGGMEPHEALKLVTINPAKQLRIDHRTGSLEAGKDADFVIWSTNPLSTYAVCEQTWIEGAKYFDREEDRAMRESVDRERRRLIQKLLVDAHGRAEPKSSNGEATSKPESQPQWLAEEHELDHRCLQGVEDDDH